MQLHITAYLVKTCMVSTFQISNTLPFDTAHTPKVVTFSWTFIMTRNDFYEYLIIYLVFLRNWLFLYGYLFFSVAKFRDMIFGNIRAGEGV
jgi:hypothetical protein